MFINFNHLKTFCNAITQKMKGFRGNWNQNDSTADDHIKNRPFYSEGVKETTIVSWSVDFNSGNISSTMAMAGPIIYQAYIEDASLKNFKIGQKYIVIWDNKTYECVVQDFHGIGLIGNLSFMGYMDAAYYEDTGEPFLIGIEEDAYGLVCGTESGVHSCVIKTIQEVVHKLDKKYIDLPNNLTTEDDVYDIMYNELAEVAFTNNYNSLDNRPDVYLRHEPIVIDNALYGKIQYDGGTNTASVGTSHMVSSSLFPKDSKYEATLSNGEDVVLTQTSYSFQSLNGVKLSYNGIFLGLVLWTSPQGIYLEPSSRVDPYVAEIRVIRGNLKIEDTDGSQVDILLNGNGAFVDALIPDTIARKSDITNDIGVQPDWNQNDETAPDYVKNRTHYDNSTILFEGGDGLDITYDRNGWKAYNDIEVTCGSKQFVLDGFTINKTGLPNRNTKTVTHTVGQVNGEDLILTITFVTNGKLKLSANIADCVFVVKRVDIKTLDDKFISPKQLRYEASISVQIEANDLYEKNEILSISDTYDDLSIAYNDNKHLYCAVRFNYRTANSGGDRRKFLLPLISYDTRLYDSDEPFYFSSVILEGETHKIVTVKVTNSNVWSFDIQEVSADIDLSTYATKSDLSTYETKADATAKLNEAKTYASGLVANCATKSDIFGAMEASY